MNASGTLDNSQTSAGTSITPSATTSDPFDFETQTGANSTARDSPPPDPSGATEITELRRRKSQTFTTPTGRQLTRLFLGSVNYRRSSGDWSRIDDTIVPSTSSGYAYRNRSNRYVAEFPSQLTDPVRFSLEDDAATMALESAAGTALAQGNRVSFAQALPGVEVRYRAEPDALKETLLLENAGVQGSFRFRIRTTAGLVARDGPGRTIDFVRNGEVVFSLAPPVMQDSSKTAEGVSDKVGVKLTEVSEGYVVTITPDPDWLSSPARVWPVAIDPTIYVNGTDPNRECTIRSQSSSVCRSPSNPFLSVGKNPSTGELARSLLRFELGDQIPRDAQISDASLKLYLTASPQSASSYEFDPVTKDWDSRVTWTTTDGSTAWTQPGGDFTAGVTLGLPEQSGFEAFNIADVVKKWVNGTLTNRGLVIKGPETGTDFVYFMSSGYLFPSYWPSLSITWQPQGRYTSAASKGWVVDGGTGDTPRVNAVKTLDKTVYVGGDFSSVGPRTGSFVSLKNDATLDQTIPEVAGNAGLVSASTAGTTVPVRAIASDGAGGWYIGGDFKYVAGQGCPRLAHIRSDGTLDPSWRPLPNGRVFSIVASGSNLYVGGAFTSIGNQTRTGIARLAASTGAVDTSWDAHVEDGAVRAIVTNGPGQMFIGGTFTTIQGQGRYRLAGLDPAGGSLLSLNQPLSSGGIVNALEVANGMLYVGGSFATLGGVANTKNLARVSPGTGLVDAQWTPRPSGGIGAGQVLTLRKDASNLYVGGGFGQIQSLPRNRLAAITLSTGLLNASWDPNPTGGPNGTLVRALAVVGSTLFVGGEFDSIAGSSRTNLGALNTTGTGTATAWSDPKVGNAVYAIALTCATNCLAQGDRVAAGGTFRTTNGVSRRNLLSLDAETGLPKNWDPKPNGPVNALELARGGLYVGGSFSSVNASASDTQARANLALFMTQPGEDPELNSWYAWPGPVTALHATTDRLYVGSSTASIPVSQSGGRYLGAYNLTTGEIDPTWDPNPDGPIYAIAEEANVVYFGGNFSNFGGGAQIGGGTHEVKNRHRLTAVYGPPTGACAVDLQAEGCPPASFWGSDTTWNPEPNGIVRALTISNGRVYAGGEFTVIAADTRAPFLASFHLVNEGGTLYDWFPAPNTSVTALDADGVSIYAGGRFLSVAGQARSGFAAIDPQNGSALAPFNPGAEVADGPNDVSGTVRAIDITDGKLWAGGDWYAIGSAAQGGIAGFPGYGYIIEPAEATRTRRRLTLSAATGSSLFNRAQFEYKPLQVKEGETIKRNDQDWLPIPTDKVVDPNNNPVSSWPLTVSGGKTPTVVWDMPSTTRNNPSHPDSNGINYINGSVQVRAVFYEPVSGQYETAPITVTLDQDAPGTADATESVGPGSLDLLSGNFSITRDDVTQTGATSDLTFSRTYNSRKPADGSDGPLGPGWLSSLPNDAAGAAYADLTVQQIPFYISDDPEDVPDTFELVTVTSSDGTKFTFVYDEGQYWPDPGSEDLILTNTGGRYLIQDSDGNTTEFVPNGSDSGGAHYRVDAVNQPAHSSRTSYRYFDVGGKMKIQGIYAPGGSYDVCQGSQIPHQCRYLWFNYYEAGNGTGQVMDVSLRGYDPDGIWHILPQTTYGYDTSHRLTSVNDLAASQVENGSWVVPHEDYAYDGAGHLITLTPPGEQPWRFSYLTASNDPNSGRLGGLYRQDPDYPVAQLLTSVYYQIPLSGQAAPYNMSAGETARWGQSDIPIDATAIFPPTMQPGSSPTPSDYRSASVHYMDRYGRETNVASPGSDPNGYIATTEWDAHNNVRRELSAKNRLTSLLTGGSASADLARTLDTQRTYSADGVNLASELGPRHLVQLVDTDSQEPARQHTSYSYDEGAPRGALPLHLLTKEVEGALADNSPEKDKRITNYSYFDDGVEKGARIRKPTSIQQDPDGRNLTTRISYSTDGLETQRTSPEGAASAGTDAHSIQTVYYTSGPQNGRDESCGNTIEWKNLPCITRPASQPDANHQLPETKLRYNRLFQVTSQTDTVRQADGNVKSQRQTTTSYDEAGRPTTTRTMALAGDVGVALPDDVSFTYYGNSSKPKTTYFGSDPQNPNSPVTRTYDALGRLKTYTDADGGVSATDYDIYGRPKTISMSQSQPSGGVGSRTYYYDSQNQVSSISEPGVGDFTDATYDADGQLTSERYPNGLVATTTYDSTGSPTDLQYVKQSSCGSSCLWLQFHVVESIHGQWMQQNSTLGHQDYAYDTVGRLASVKETPTAGTCTTRGYTYDDDSNRKTMQTDTSSSSTCGGNGPTQSYSYDAADRLTGGDVSYDDYGRITTLGNQYAGGGGTSHDLTSTYYRNDLLQSQTQAAVTNTYGLDPLMRQRQKTRQLGTQSPTVETYHYSGESDSVSWTTKGNTVTRSIPEIGGNLAATQDVGGTATLQLTNLHGDVVATASASASVSSYEVTARVDEFGAPEQGGELPRYGWLGGKGRRTELDSGVIQMGARSYVPTLGRFLQRDPSPGGSANAYDYANQDCVNTYDLDGRRSKKGHKLHSCSSARIPIRDTKTHQRIATLHTYLNPVTRTLTWQLKFTINGMTRLPAVTMNGSVFVNGDLAKRYPIHNEPSDYAFHGFVGQVRPHALVTFVFTGFDSTNRQHVFGMVAHCRS